MTQITGAEAEALINSQIKAHSDGIADALPRFAPSDGFYAWLDTIRAIEEFINLPLFGLDDDEALARTIENFQLDQLDPAALAPIRQKLIGRFGGSFAQRFLHLVLQASAIGAAFRTHDMMEAASGFQTVAHAIGYFQSRRRHLMAMLYALPTAGQGRDALEQLDTINQLLPLVEHSGITITGLYQKLMLARVFPDFALDVEATGFTANHHLEPLDAAYLEPERAGIVEMQTSRTELDLAESLEPVDPRLIFSAAELRNTIRLLEATYAEFDLAGTAFGPVSRLVRDCLRFCEDDYQVKLSAADYARLVAQNGLSNQIENQLVHRGGNYVACTNAIAPFIAVDGTLVSTVTFLGRFLYYWKSTCLNRVRRFQVRSGFIFEDNVKAALTRQGFTVTNMKRVNRKEFDVVATCDGVIYNVQCKNNLVDLERIESDPARFARYNRQLDRYYARALAKEEAREALLKQRLGLPTVRHLVVSRFPVATTNSRVISFARIDRFREIATG